MKYATYSNYKASNIGWIMDFPAHWELKRLKYIANRSEVKIEAEEDNPLPYIGLEQVEPWTGRLVNLDDDLIPTGVSNYFAAGDTLFGKLRPYLAKACNVDFDGLCSSELLVLRGKTYDRKFLLYQLLSHGFINLVDSSTFGSKMPRASWDFIGICELPVPPVDEQQTIARFLDAKTAQIDELIAKKRQLIDKLKEKRQALIARTVTRGLPPEAAKAAGLDPNPKMKESGVDWIGAVPSTWGIVPLKRRAHFVEGPGIMASDFIDEGVPLIRISGVQAKYASLNGANYLDPELVSQKWEHFKTKSGDLLISGSASTGLCSEVDEATEGCIPYTGIIIIRALKKSASNAFLRWYFQSNQFLSQVQIMKTGSTIQHFGPTHLSRMTIALPHKVMEQEAIAAFLDTTIAEFDSMAATVEAAIERLVEYRQAVIISSITGKIDVRELA